VVLFSSFFAPSFFSFFTGFAVFVIVFSLEESGLAAPLLVIAIPAPNHRLLVAARVALYYKELRLTLGLAGPALCLLFSENVEYFNTTENGRC
jgi:hypothetical protein